jgi:hypothetical protein
MAAKKKNIKKTSKASRKKSLKSLSQTHGKEEGVEPTTLDQIWGDSGMGKYKTIEKAEYEEGLDNMTKSDLQTHATKVGLIPVDNREILKGRLMREFTKHVNGYRKPASRAKTEKVSSAVKKILSEGK